MFAGATLIAIMLVTLALSPGSVLLSAAIGSIVVAALSMLAAALVVPAALQLLGHRVNSWQVGAAHSARVAAGRARSALRRPARWSPPRRPCCSCSRWRRRRPGSTCCRPTRSSCPTTARASMRISICATPASGPGSRWSSPCARGPSSISDPSGGSTKYERTLSRLPAVRLVVGPGSIADAADGLSEAPSTEEALATVRRGERGLERVDEELDRADSGVDRLFTGLGTAAAGARRLAAGTGTAGAGAGSLAGGAARASAGAVLLAGGISQAVAATDDFEAALARAEAASVRDSSGAPGSRRAARGAFASAPALWPTPSRDGWPAAPEAGSWPGPGQARPREAARARGMVEGELAKAFDALRMMTAGRLDPLYERTIRAVGTALAAARGRDPRSRRGRSSPATRASTARLREPSC